MPFLIRFQTIHKKALFIVLVIIGTVSFGCVSNVPEFGKADAVAAKHFVTEEILPIYSRGDGSRLSRAISTCDTYEKVVDRLNSHDVPAILKWKKPEIRFSNSEFSFVFFAPRPRPLFEICTDNCLKPEDIPVDVFTYSLSSEEVGEWKEDSRILWNGVYAHRSYHPCENLVF